MQFKEFPDFYGDADTSAAHRSQTANFDHSEFNTSTHQICREYAITIPLIRSAKIATRRAIRS